jgi:uncharacterized membrane protein
MLGTFIAGLWVIVSIALYLLTTKNEKYGMPPFLLVWPGMTYLFWRWLRRIR